MDYVTRQFINLAKKLRKDVRKSLDGIKKSLDKKIESDKEARKSAHTNGNANPFSLELRFPRSIQTRTVVDTKQNEPIEWLKLAVGVATLVAVVAYTVLAAYQLEEMRISAKAAGDAAKTADDTFKASQNIFVINERPYMVLDGAPQFQHPPAIDTPIKVNVTIKNIGKTPADKISLTVSLVKFVPGKKNSEGFAKLNDFITSAFDALRNDDAAVARVVSPGSYPKRPSLALTRSQRLAQPADER